MRDDPLAKYASAGGALFDWAESLIAYSQRRRGERDEVWEFHLQNRMRVSRHGLSLLKVAAARLASWERPGL